MTKELFNRIVDIAESRGRGWLSSSNVPACNVYVDGILIKNVARVNRIRGVVEVVLQPIRLDKHRKKVMTKRVRGSIEVEPLGLR